jgi:hypothetical protein
MLPDLPALDETMDIFREHHPKAWLPEDRQKRIWRYMDFWKFESLVKRRSLYLCRLDRLQDRFEGRLSQQQIREMNGWLDSVGHPQLVQTEKKHRQRKRKQTFVSCWCMSEHDLDLMWKAYTHDTQAVAIQSTIERLERVADKATEYWPLDVSGVKYVHHVEGEFIDCLDGFDAVICKDVHFELDHEIRLIHWPNIQEPTPEETVLPVDLLTLIESIVLHQRLDDQPLETIDALLQECGLGGLPVRRSRDDRPLEE